jgi:hypothetical protein
LMSAEMTRAKGGRRDTPRVKVVAHCQRLRHVRRFGDAQTHFRVEIGTGEFGRSCGPPIHRAAQTSNAPRTDMKERIGKLLSTWLTDGCTTAALKSPFTPPFYPKDRLLCER